eukprot:2437347-Alexandrium_andersonii.AAC.1
MGSMRGWLTRVFNPHQSAHGGLPATTNGLSAPRRRIARSRSSGPSKSQGPGRKSNAPAGRTPRRGR